MKNIHSETHWRRPARKSQSNWWAGPLALLATLLALPATANIDIPNDPLTTGSRVPPNILFVLDDSGSMAWAYMYNPDINRITGGDIDSTAGDQASTTSTSSARMYDQNYVTNTLYYNPHNDYSAWLDSTGTPVTGGAAYGDAFNNDILIQHTPSGSVSGTTNLADNTRTFYMPKPGATALSDAREYFRYQIRATNQRIVRSERLEATGGNANEGIAGVGCDTSTTGWGWRNCTYTTPDVKTVKFPAGRSEAEERANFATWFSFHRTRTKAAKAGASIAFNDLDTKVRVGFRTIWGRNGATTTGNWPRQSVPIPVEYNDGLFDNPNGVTGANNNRQRWYNRLFAAEATNGTPLRSALNNAGLYFSDRSITGAYGPQSGADQLSCRQNFTILTTDGFWNGDGGFSSGGDQDGTNGPIITGPGAQSYQYIAAVPFRDGPVTSRQNTLADVAMRYWKNDLLPDTDMPNTVPTTAANRAFWQHMVTFGISIGLKGTLDQSSVQQVLADGTPKRLGLAVNWPAPAADSVNNIDDLLHAAVNGRGTFLSAGDPKEFSEGLSGALKAISELTGSSSNVAANSTSLDADTRVFQANYVSSVWTGELRSQPVTVAGGVEPVNCSGPTQPANGWCASKGIPALARKVFTSNGHNDGVTVTTAAPNQVPRVFPAQATTAQLDSLFRAWPAAVSAVENAAYIAGARGLELSNPGGMLRNRNNLLGDIIGSSPAYVPNTGTIYIGANDGMLHAIDAGTGVEQFAYIPGIINWNDLGSLSRPDYGHRYFVDGPIVVTTQQQTPGHNILVGALGKGGRGLYALDVSNPATFGAGNNVKWERANTPGGNMGLVQGRPVLAKVRNGGTTNNAVVLGNGVNSVSGRAALIVLDIETGDVIREIAVGPAGLSNGLSSPTGVLGADGRTLAYVYAGDMLGNVWKFDLTGASPASWSGASLFTAMAGGVAQPITGAVTLSTHPQTNLRWVFFGTGRYMTQGDVSNTAVQSMYGFVDDGTAIVRGPGGNLTQRTVEVTSGDVSGYPVRGFQAKAALPASSKGWYIDLPDSGERVVQDAQMVSTFLITASIVPSGDACESGGSGYINALDAFTGTSAGGSYFDLNSDGASNEVIGTPSRPVGSVNVRGGMPTLPNLLRGRFVVSGSADSEVRGTATLRPRWDRVSWREITAD